MLRDATLAALLEILERNGIPHELNRAENFLVMRETRSRILFRAVEEFERLRGSNLAWFGLDELTYTAEEAWLRLEGRLRDPKASRLCGFAVWTPKGFDWVYQRFVAEPVDGYETVTARPFENRLLLDRVPDYYERLKSSYDERFYQQEVLGEYLHLHAGRVYYAFDREENVGEVRGGSGRGRCCGRWILTWIRCARWWRRWMGEEVTVLDEIVLSRASTQQACEEFQNAVSGACGGVGGVCGCDRGAMQTTGTSDLAILKKFFRSGEYGTVEFKIPKSNPAVRDRVMLMNAKLCRRMGTELR